MPKTLNPICGHQRDYACVSCGKCDGCCECPVVRAGAVVSAPEIEHVDSKVIADRWRMLRIMAMDKEARRRVSDDWQREMREADERERIEAALTRDDLAQEAEEVAGTDPLRRD